MATTKKIVCLANSRKLSGRCIAGVELAEGQFQWIRPVSGRANQEVSEYERQYQDGSDPKLLDIIDVPLIRHQPEGCQQENWLLDPEQYWKKVGTFDWDELYRFSETRGTLWQNGNCTYNGLNDQILLEQARQEVSSLKLVYVDELHLHIFAPGKSFGNTKRRVQAQFCFNSSDYKLWVTDPYIEKTFLAMEDGTFHLGQCFLTISLGEPYKGYRYKLVATVLEKPS